MFRIIFCLLFSALFASESTTAITENEPSVYVEGIINAITGDLCIPSTDLIVQGAEPIPLRRMYITGRNKQGIGMQLAPTHTNLTYFPASTTLLATDSNGSLLTFKRKAPNSPHFDPIHPADALGLSNTSRGVISAHTHLQNYRAEIPSKREIIVHTPDGTARYYRFITPDVTYTRTRKQPQNFELYAEKLPNGHWILYDYKPYYSKKYKKTYRCLTKIRTTNLSQTITFSSVNISWPGPYDKNEDQHFQTSDGRYFNYLFDIHKKEFKEGTASYFRMKSVFSYNFPSTNFSHCNLDEPTTYFLNTLSLPDSRTLSFIYENDRVKTISAPAGHDAAPVVTHRFFYDIPNRTTDVFDSENHKTRYKYSINQQIEAIDRFIGSEKLHHSETFSWQGPTLLSRTFCDQNRKPLFARTFAYDSFGNVKEEKFTGNLSGQAENETVIKKFTYNNDKRLSRLEEPNGSVTLFTYLPSTNLVFSKLICDGDKIKIRHFFEYDKDNLLFREITDDGTSPNKDEYISVKTRLIKQYTSITDPQSPYIGMPQIIEEKYWDGTKDVLLKKNVLHYTIGGKVEKQDVYDAEGTYRYSLTTKYNNYGLPIEETNAIGQTAISDYDANGNKFFYKEHSGKLTTKMDYDFSNRLIKTEEIGSDGQKRIALHKYDTKHNRISTTDYQGNETRFVPDPFGHITETHLSSVPNSDGTLIQPVIHATYDSAGNQISATTPNGTTTSTSYNAYGKPTSITYPDGSKEAFIYNLDGTLKTHINQEGSETTYTYDFLGRIKSLSTPLSTETYEYDAFNLISKTDAEGNTTYYEYDGAGRKIAEQIGKERTEFSYDVLGRMHRVQKDDIVLITEYDLLDRVIEEREESISGKVLKKVHTEYDASGNKYIVTRFINGKEAQEIFLYDAFNRPIVHTDALGHTTRVDYNDNFINAQNQKVLQKITTDPSGLQIVETFGTHGQLVSTEKRNNLNESLYQENLSYDLNGNLQFKHLFAKNGKVSHFWEYDSLDRVKTQTEAYGSERPRTTTYAYTPLNLIDQITKPDGVVLTHSYDILGNPAALISSDQTIHYSFTYNRIGQEIEASDHISKQTASKKYDPQGRLLQDTLPHGYILFFSYDTAGRRRVLTLPDNSSIEYTYEGSLLKTIHRNGYTHEYTAYDLDGNILEEKLIHDAGTIAYSIDALGRRITHASPYLTQNILEFDPAGNLKKMERNQTSSEYTYDSLHQLQTEGGESNHTYLHDAFHNRLQKDNETYSSNTLNQLDSLSCDPNGNPIQDKDRIYVYDALDRLTSIETPSQKVLFTYDSNHRRLSKTVFTFVNGSWKQTSHLLFLYDGSKEIGAISNGTITELRILSDAPSEIGSAIAFELHGKAYVPIHDLQGNLSALVDPHTRQIIESYTYSAFGEGKNSSLLSNPWRYASKRVDDESGLIMFGHRYYDPSLGRWLTPDPAGFTDSMNRYAFVLNNPFTFTDLYGLSAEFNTDIRMSEDPFFVPTTLSSLDSIKPASQEFSALRTSTFSGLPRNEASSSNIFNYASRLPDQVISEAKHALWSGVQQTVMLGTSLILNSFGARTPDNVLGPLSSVFSSVHTLIDETHGTNFSYQYSGSFLLGLSRSEGYIPLPITAAPAVAGRIANLGKTVFPRQNLEILESTSKQTSVLNGRQIWSATKQLNPVQNAFRHWKDHGRDFSGIVNAKQYVEKAFNFNKFRSENVLLKFRNNGEFVLYDTKTNIFAVYTKDGIPKTMYKPSITRHPYKTNLEYFNAQ